MARVNHSSPVDLTLLAKHRGKQFEVRLRAIKTGAGLVKSPRPLDVGERLILHVPGTNSKRAVVQLFASVVRYYEKQKAFALRWDKLVSPSGTTALKEFLQSTLGIPLSPGTAMAEESADGEMVYYDFAAQELHLPNQGTVVGRSSPSRNTPLPGNVADFGTSPLPMDPNGKRTTGPLAGGPSPAMKPSIEERATAAAQEADGAAQPFYKEDEEVVELFGMKVSKDNWDRLENLEYSGSHSADRTSPPPASRPGAAARPRPESPRPAPLPAGTETTEEGDNKVSRFFRKIADKLTDKD